MAPKSNETHVYRRVIAALLSPALVWLGFYWFYEDIRAGKEWNLEKSGISGPFLGLLLFCMGAWAALLVALYGGLRGQELLVGPPASRLKAGGIRGLLVGAVNVVTVLLLVTFIWTMVTEAIRLRRPPLYWRRVGGVVTDWFIFLWVLMLPAIMFLLCSLQSLRARFGQLLADEDTEPSEKKWLTPTVARIPNADEKRRPRWHQTGVLRASANALTATPPNQMPHMAAAALGVCNVGSRPKGPSSRP